LNSSLLTPVEEIFAPDGRVEGVSLRNQQTKESRDIPLDGVFVAIGHDPNTIVFKGKLDMDANGYLLCQARQPHRDSRRVRCG